MKGKNAGGKGRPSVTKYHVTLEEQERADLEKMIAAGRAAARKLTHARILLKTDEGGSGPGWKDEQVAEALEVGVNTVGRVRQRFVEEGLEQALNPKKGLRNQARLLDGEGEAHLLALACSQPPAGHERWTLALLADRMVALGVVPHLSYETVREALKKTNSSHG